MCHWFFDLIEEEEESQFGAQTSVRSRDHGQRGMCQFFDLIEEEEESQFGAQTNSDSNYTTVSRKDGRISPNFCSVGPFLKSFNVILLNKSSKSQRITTYK